MKKTLTITFTILSIILILDSLNAGEALVMFFFVGAIPGTNISIQASHMLEACTFLAGFTLSRVTLNLVRAHAAVRRDGQGRARVASARA